jgi:hypothetical protein
MKGEMANTPRRYYFYSSKENRSIDEKKNCVFVSVLE